MADAPQNVVTVLTTDHREVEALFAELERPGLDSQRRRDLADDMTMELVRHAVAEEEYLYPAVREHLPDGDALADKELQDHAEVERTLNELDGLDADDPRFDELLTSLMSSVRQHVADEENRLLPRLTQACSSEQLVDLGGKIEMAKKAAPTRPHPSAPDRPPLNKLLGPGTSLVDRIRDALSGRGSS